MYRFMSYGSECADIIGTVLDGTITYNNLTNDYVMHVESYDGHETYILNCIAKCKLMFAHLDEAVRKGYKLGK